MHSTRERAARLRAKRAIRETTGEEGSMTFLNEFSTHSRGGSITCTLSRMFVRHHGLNKQEPILEFFDRETGALVILPKSSDYGGELDGVDLDAIGGD